MNGALVPVWTVADAAEAWEAAQECETVRGETSE